MPPDGLLGGILLSAQALKPTNADASRNTLRTNVLHMLRHLSAIFVGYFTHGVAIPCACRPEIFAKG